jgi:hypothetical protein
MIGMAKSPRGRRRSVLKVIPLLTPNIDVPATSTPHMAVSDSPMRRYMCPWRLQKTPRNASPHKDMKNASARSWPENTVARKGREKLMASRCPAIPGILSSSCRSTGKTATHRAVTAIDIQEEK